MKIIVVGTGISGLTLAIQAARRGVDVVVVERSSHPRDQGYMIDFFGPGYDAAEAMGLIPAIEQVSYRLADATFVDDNGRARARVAPEQFAAGALVNLMRPDLEHVLLDHLPATVDLRFGVSPEGVVEDGDGVRVSLSNGDDLRADVVIGADGIHSTVRDLVFGPPDHYVRHLGFHTAAWIFDSERARAAVDGRSCLTESVDRQLGFYGLRDGRVATFAVHASVDPDRPVDVRGYLKETYDGMGWLVPDAIAGLPPTDQIYYDQIAQVVMPAWSHGRVVLLGDAAYAVSLLAGQGASLGMAGAYLLAEQLATAPTVAQAVQHYERLWRPVVEEKQRTGRSAARWFLPRSLIQLRLRRVMLRLGHLPLVDRLVVSRLAGKSSVLIKNLSSYSASTRENESCH